MTAEKKKNELADKPGSVLSSHSSRPNVTIWLKQPTRETRGPRVVDQQPFPLFGLAPDGVYPAIECCHRRGALLPHHFTLTQSPKQCLGGIFSVALSVGLHPPGITWHLALWSPDFPPWRYTPQRLLGQLIRNYKPKSTNTYHLFYRSKQLAAQRYCKRYSIPLAHFIPIDDGWIIFQLQCQLIQLIFFPTRELSRDMCRLL